MIEVTFYRKGGETTGFKIEGHANSAPHGSDLVCAAVSILATTAVATINIISRHQPVAETQTLVSGLCELRDIKDRYNSEILGALKFLETGLSVLSAAHPSRVATIYCYT